MAAILQVSLAPTVTAPVLARAEVTAWLTRERDAGAFIEVAKLLISELVTNCLRHASITPDQPLRLTASLRATTLRLELRDDGTQGTIARRAPQQSGIGGGFGLDLVAQLSNSWGVERDAHGTTVWLELSAPAHATA